MVQIKRTIFVAVMLCSMLFSTDASAQQDQAAQLKEAYSLFAKAYHQRNDSMKVSALMRLVNYHYTYNSEQLDTIVKWVDRCTAAARRCRYWSAYFEAKRVLTNAYIYANRYELAIIVTDDIQKEANKLNNNEGFVSASMCQALAYMSTERWKEAHAALTSAYRQYGQCKSSSTRIALLMMILNYYVGLEKYQGLYPYLGRLDSELDNVLRYNPEYRNSLNDHFLIYECLCMFYYAKTGKVAEALRHERQADNYTRHIRYAPYRKFLVDAKCYVAICAHEYSKAIVLNDSSLLMARKYNMSDDEIITTQNMRADIYYKQGKYQLSLDLYRRSAWMRDTLSDYLSRMQIDEIHQIYHLDKLQMDNEITEGYILTTVMCLLILAGAIICVFIVRYVSIKKKLQRNEHITAKALDESEKNNRQKGRFLAMMSHTIRTQLHSIVGFSRALAIDNELTQTERASFAGIIRLDTARLIYLVNSVLDLSRLEAKMTKWQMAQADLVALCQDAIVRAKAKYPNAVYSFDADLQECIVETDASRIAMLIESMLVGTVDVSDFEGIVSLVVRKYINTIEIKAIGSPIAIVSSAMQSTSLRNDINRLTISHFGGMYVVDDYTVTVCASYPLSELSKS